MHKDLENKLWARVDRGDAKECWPWTKATNQRGYGQLFVRTNEHGKNLHVMVHRLSWEIANDRPIPPGLKVLHSCDNPPCVNPAHLRIGTQIDNMRDMVKRNRQTYQQGVQSNVKLTESQVLEIFVDRRNQATIAAEYGVSHQQVYRIKNKQTWKYLWK